MVSQPVKSPSSLMFNEFPSLSPPTKWRLELRGRRGPGMAGREDRRNCLLGTHSWAKWKTCHKHRRLRPRTTMLLKPRDNYKRHKNSSTPCHWAPKHTTLNPGNPSGTHTPSVMLKHKPINVAILNDFSTTNKTTARRLSPLLNSPPFPPPSRLHFPRCTGGNVFVHRPSVCKRNGCT